MTQAEAAKFLDLVERTAGRPSAVDMRDNPAERKTRAQKYGNEKVTDASGERFDSKAEYRRWVYLVSLQRAREIRGLQRQVRYELIPAQPRPSGGTERACFYVADFVYRRMDEEIVVEDVKGAVTPEYRLKRKLMLWVHGIEVQEVRS